MSSNSHSTKKLSSNLPPPQRPKRSYTHPTFILTPSFQNSVSFEEPVPDSSHNKSTQNLRVQIIDNDVARGLPLPYTPSPYHLLETVSESKAYETLHTPSPILIETIGTNTPQSVNRLSNSLSPSTMAHYRISSSSLSNISNYGMLSCATQSHQTTQNNNSEHRNTQNNSEKGGNTNGNNNRDSNQSNENNNGGSNGGANGAGNGGKKDGNGGSDKNNNNKKDTNTDETKNQSENEDETEEEKDEKCNENDSDSVYIKWSEFTANDMNANSELSTEAQEFVPSKSANGSKSLPTRHKIRANDCALFRYTPIGDRAQGCVKISKHFTDSIIPKMVRENIENVYDFLDKSIAVAIYHSEYYDNGHFRIFNYGFHRLRDDCVLYCIVDKINGAKHRNFRYSMREKLFTEKDIYRMLKLTANELPKPVCNLNAKFTVYMQRIMDVLSDKAAFCQNVIFKTKWHKQYIFNARHSKDFHKQRYTFSVTKNEFINIIQNEIHRQNKVQLMPIVMFNALSQGYRLEYIHIIRIRRNTDVGISYVYDNDYGIKVTGIHLNKTNIIKQHRLALMCEDCHCLDGFKSEINDLRIGNPDEDINKYKDLKKKHTNTKYVNQSLIDELKCLKNDTQTETARFQNEIDRLKQENSQIMQLQMINIQLLQQNAQLQKQTAEVPKLHYQIGRLNLQLLQKHNILENYRRMQSSPYVSSISTFNSTPSGNRSRSYSVSAPSITPQSLSGSMSYRTRGISNESLGTQNSFSALANNLGNVIIVPPTPYTPAYTPVNVNNNSANQVTVTQSNTMFNAAVQSLYNNNIPQ